MKDNIIGFNEDYSPNKGENEFKKFILTLLSFCLDITDIDYPLSTAGISELYQGKFPSNDKISWLDENEHYKQILLLSYRKSIKLALDLFSLGILEVEGNYDDIVDYINEYEENYYFGIEGDDEWSSNMKNEKSHLFSMKRLSKNEFSITLLSLQEYIIIF